ncbi:MAG: DUF6691 family protein [Verrucomicrobiota bacterium]
MKTWILILIAGVFFGAGLALSGMTNPGRVIGFLNITDDWDPTLAFVMGGALCVFGGGALIFRRQLPKAESDPISNSLIVGSILFGIGWGISGFCPGPALANLAWLRFDAVLFVPAMAVGMIIAQRVFNLDR